LAVQNGITRTMQEGPFPKVMFYRFSIIAIAIPSFISYRNKSKISACLATAASIRGTRGGYAAASAGNSFPSEALMPDNEGETLRRVVNQNGGTLKASAADQGFVGSQIDYTATPDPADPDVIGDWKLTLHVIGVPESNLGYKIMISPSQIERQAGPKRHKSLKFFACPE